MMDKSRVIRRTSLGFAATLVGVAAVIGVAAVPSAARPDIGTVGADTAEVGSADVAAGRPAPKTCEQPDPAARPVPGRVAKAPSDGNVRVAGGRLVR
jgi:hypothetical protein